LIEIIHTNILILAQLINTRCLFEKYGRVWGKPIKKCCTILFRLAVFELILFCGSMCHQYVSSLKKPSGTKYICLYWCTHKVDSTFLVSSYQFSKFIHKQWKKGVIEQQQGTLPGGALEESGYCWIAIPNIIALVGLHKFSAIFIDCKHISAPVLSHASCQINCSRQCQVQV
jgi:hypothetical protein